MNKLNNKPTLLSFVLLLIGLTSLSLSSYGQDVKVNSIEDDDLIYMINRIENLSYQQTDDLSIKIFSVENLPGSAGFPSGEITHDLLIAVSEFGEYPEQSLFRISSFYGPEIKEWDTKAKDPKAIIVYGPLDDKQELVLWINLHKIVIE